MLIFFHPEIFTDSRFMRLAGVETQEPILTWAQHENYLSNRIERLIEKAIAETDFETVRSQIENLVGYQIVDDSVIDLVDAVMQCNAFTAMKSRLRNAWADVSPQSARQYFSDMARPIFKDTSLPGSMAYEMQRQMRELYDEKSLSDFLEELGQFMDFDESDLED